MARVRAGFSRPGLSGVAEPPILGVMPNEPGPLSPQQLAELSAARRRAGGIRRTVGVARLSGWTTAIFGGLTLLGGLWGLPALLLGAAMLSCAVNELRAASRLRALDARAPARLAVNQLLLCASLCAYCGWSLWSALTGPVDPELAALAATSDIAASAERLTQSFSVIVYGAAIVICILVQSLTALYYLSRARLVREYARQTPGWIIEIQRAA